MTTIKAYTDLEQSEKLAKILPIETADMYYHNRTDMPGNYSLPIVWKHNNPLLSQETPCWSLAALLGVLPNKLQIVLAINDFQGYRKEKYVIGSVAHDKYDCFADNPVDACYELILKLHERKLL